ncbi:hypothetical protein LIER_17651 [Lithospermum erythrorhizon]|uniref:Avr9/Cf-9 rapidly elicited protein 146 n=1 Tax=Lithospermum erythrorhizon TaxID=34254 RepID=A0AAV3QC48_LITER
MEQNVPTLAKRFWHMIRVAMFMLRKGISKSKLLTDLNLMMKRGKIAGKAIHNLMFHHRGATFPTHIDEYEFSCSNTPSHNNFLQLNKRKLFRFSGSARSLPEVMEADYVTPKVVMQALEMLQSEAASPALPGFGRTPMVRQLRITDSPFPLNYGLEEENYVDDAAEDFIMKFYKELRKQNNTIVA